MQQISPAEKCMIDLLIDEGPQKCGEHDVDVIKALYVRGLVYLDVPIEDNDHIAGTCLENHQISVHVKSVRSSRSVSR